MKEIRIGADAAAKHKHQYARPVYAALDQAAADSGKHDRGGQAGQSDNHPAEQVQRPVETVLMLDNYFFHKMILHLFILR